MKISIPIWYLALPTLMLMIWGISNFMKSELEPSIVQSHTFKTEYDVIEYRLTDSVNNICFDERIYNIRFNETQVYVRCELDSNRHHVNHDLRKKH